MKYLFISLSFISILVAQFSPGKLSKYHTHLEGNENCILCHKIGNNELSDGCILCHEPLASRIIANKGYHKDKVSNCGDCHSDHNGLEFELVYWPKDINDFNHDETDYLLTGKHSEVKCSNCHTKDNIIGKKIIEWSIQQNNISVLDRTFLGLEESCMSCHDDIHENEVSHNCTECHNTTNWHSAAADFDHDRAKYLLTGAHKKVACEKCHKIEPQNSKKIWQLTGMAYNNCNQCHNDNHKGSYGEKCEMCHITENWKDDLIPFDHSKTKYALLGKHSNLSCSKCHDVNNNYNPPIYEKCIYCHQDEHDSQFSTKLDNGDCKSCHDTNGFTPTNYTVEMHQSAHFTLEGGHLAIACNQCHINYETKSGKSTAKFVWDSVTCSNCHIDPHRNQFQAHFQNDCTQCHTVNNFKIVEFDHNKSQFPLDGKHKNVDCDKCHNVLQDINGQFIQYKLMTLKCSECHTLTDDFR